LLCRFESSDSVLPVSSSAIVCTSRNVPSDGKAKLMRQTRVVILDGGSVLGEGAAQILRDETDIEVTVIPYLDRETSLHHLLLQVPDIILIDGSGPLGPDDVLKMLSKRTALMDVRIIYIHDDDNMIEVFHRRSIVATHSTDLVALVRSS
jgi:hypothetical protein